MKVLLAVIVSVLVLTTTTPVIAQGLPTVRVEVVPLDPTIELPVTFWSRVRLMLGSRALPIIRPAPGTKFIVQASAYASSPYQTDSSPCITAAGTRVRPGVVATNFLPMGTILRINNDLYIVEDRMNTRYNGRYLDIWYRHTSDALEFGRRRIEIEVVSYGTPGQALNRAAAAPVATTAEVATEEVVAEEAETAAVDEPSAYQRANLRFIAALQRVTSFLPGRVARDVNKYDVDCTIK